MQHGRAIELEHLLIDLLAEKRGTVINRGASVDGITVDADAFDNDANAIEGLWKAIQLLQE